MNQVEAVKIIRQNVRSLSAAAACAQLDMAAFKREGRNAKGNGDAPLKQLDTLAESLAAPAMNSGAKAMATARKAPGGSLSHYSVAVLG